MYFLNKKFNLVYGEFLRKLLKKDIKTKIHYYKQPGKIVRAGYQEIIDDVQKAVISDDEVLAVLGKQSKKTIAHIDFGLLEKSYNKA